MREMKLVEVVEKQDAIIRLQSGVIDDLFRLLSQHITAYELGTLPAIGKINEAARMRAEIE